MAGQPVQEKRLPTRPAHVPRDYRALEGEPEDGRHVARLAPASPDRSAVPGVV